MAVNYFTFILGYFIFYIVFNNKSAGCFLIPSATDLPGSSSNSSSDATYPNTTGSLSNSTGLSSNDDADRQGSGFIIVDVNSSDISLDGLKTLQASLLEGYDTTIRPRLKQHDTVDVNTTFALTSVVDFDTTGQRINVLGYFIVTWKDEVVQWNPDHYSGTSSIKLPLRRIWYPPLVIGKLTDHPVLGSDTGFKRYFSSKSKQICFYFAYNFIRLNHDCYIRIQEVDTDFSGTYDGSRTIGKVDVDRVTVSSTGVVQWVPDGIFNFMCEVSVKHYPFDAQTCELIYYVSDETISSVNLTGQHSLQLGDYVENSEWRLVEASSMTKEIYNTNFVFLVFKIERRADFTIYTMVIPLVTLALLNIFSFLVPIESGEKGSLAITLFLAYGFFVTLTRDALPHNSVQVSYYVVYIIILLVLSVFTVIYVIIESKVYTCLGTSPFHVCGWLQSKKSNDKKITPAVENGPPPEKESLNEITMTWADVLGRLDIIAFVSSAIFVALFSIIIWILVISGN